MKYKELFENTYKGKRVFLTGHTGFKGSWLLTWLFQTGAIVKGYALAPESENDLYNLIKGDKLCESAIADIRDKQRLQKEILDFQPDFIFHLAAQPLVRRSYEMPLYTYEVNVNGTAHIMESIRNLEKKCSVVVITTDKVYENIEADYAYTETDKLGGYDPYSSSKAAAEIIVNSYRNSFFSPAEYAKHRKTIATTRAGNVIGGGDRAKDRIVPDIISSLEKNVPVIVRNPDAVRPWQHVLEPLSGYLLLGARLTELPEVYSGAWNFGPYKADTLTVKQIVELSLSFWESGEFKIDEQKKQPHEARLLQLDINKAIKKLGWQPKWNTTQAIQQTLIWYKNAVAEDPFAYSVEQMKAYQDL